MDVAWFRDLIICISGAVLAVVLIFTAVLMYLLYRKTKSVLDSIKIASKNIQDITSILRDEIAKPVIGVAAFIQGIRQGIKTISKFFRKQGGGRHG